MLFKLLLLFTLVPAAELGILIAFGQRIGILPTLAIILTTGLVGAWLARREGVRTWRELRSVLARGGVPGDPLLGGVAILVGGALLLTPGLMTDVLGFLLLLPPTRAAILHQLRRRFEQRLREGHGRVEVHTWTAGPPRP